MDITNRFAMMVDVLAEIAQEEQAHSHSGTPQSPPLLGLPSLKSVLADASPLPHETLFLGLAEDGLPVLLNLLDPIPGPILITGDQASGKTTLLQTIARAADLLHSPSAVQYGVITPHPNEWKNFHRNQNNVGIYLTQDDNAEELLHSLVTWAHNNKGEQKSILLLIDDVEAVTNLKQQAEKNFRWLLLRGPARRVWPIVTLNTTRAQSMKTWLEFFRTRLFGYIENPNEANFVTGCSNHTLNHLSAGSQFSMREGNKLVNFLAPTIDYSPYTPKHDSLSDSEGSLRQ
ncbi:MAG: hypothetical protein Q8O48_02610, partial [Anaerolineales bacterium]|nr:hypothetical protein [Anaerolineales bacterium]